MYAKIEKHISVMIDNVTCRRRTTFVLLRKGNNLKTSRRRMRT